MAVVVTLSNHYKYQRDVGNINASSDVFKIILMNTTFTFDPDAHATLADVTADQLATGNGYTQNNKTLANVSVVESDTNNRSEITWDDVTFTATGGDFPASGSACIYDDTTSDDTIVGGVDFGADHTVVEDQSMQLQDIAVYSS